MQLSQSVKLKQKQSLVMTPQLQQAIKLLQLSNLELTQHLQEQVDENPFLELHEPKNSEIRQNQQKTNLRMCRQIAATNRATCRIIIHERKRSTGRRPDCA